MSNIINNTLVIIGNGFDMAHGYNTTYKSFIEKISDNNLDIFKSYCASYDDIDTWYRFEENIQVITNNLGIKAYSESYNYDENRNEITQLKNVFKEIHHLLIDYLSLETNRKPILKLANVEKYLNKKVKVINFNYTKIAEAYTDEVFYVHGSLDENDIILGYDYRHELCLFRYDDMFWSKINCRMALAFRRFLKNKLNLTPSSFAYRQFISSFEKYQHYANSGRGIDEKVETEILNFDVIDRFIKEYKNKDETPEFDYKNITTIVVMGHGIEADKVYLDKIISKCINLEKVVIYRYEGESEDSYKPKVDFFNKYCKNIESMLYTK